MSSQEIRVVAILQARPGQETALAEAISAIVGPSRAEPGCRFYTPHGDLEVPGRFVFVERWDSLQALDQHARTEHFLTFVATIAPLIQGELQVLKLAELPG